MTFLEALTAAFKDGDRITRRSWANRSIYMIVEDGLLKMNGFMEGERWVDDGKLRGWIISEQDFFAHDWEVLADA